MGRFARLGAITNEVEIKLGGPNAVPEFKFTYGTIMLTNLPDDVVVKGGNEPLATRRRPLRLAYDRPGRHVYDLYERDQKVDTVTTNLPSGAVIVLQSEIASREYVNGIGLRLEEVKDLFGPGKDGWVGKVRSHAVQYQQVMGANSNPSKYKGPTCPWTMCPAAGGGVLPETHADGQTAADSVRPGRINYPLWKNGSAFPGVPILNGP